MANAAINETRNIKGTFFSTLGKTFSSYAEAEKWRDSTIARRESIAGRTLTDYELEFGLKRAKDDRNLLKRIEDADWRMTPTPSTEPPRHPMDDPSYLNALRGEKKQTRKDLERDARAAYDARMAKENPSPPDAEREAAHEYALSVWEKVAFSDAPMSHLAFASRLRDQAAGDLSVFRSMSEEFSALTQIRNAEIEVAVAADRQRVEQRLNSVTNIAPFGDAKAQAAGLSFGDRVMKMHGYGGEVSYRVVNGDVVKSEWAEADAPAEIVEAAQ